MRAAVKVQVSICEEASRSSVAKTQLQRVFVAKPNDWGDPAIMWDLGRTEVFLAWFMVGGRHQSCPFLSVLFISLYQLQIHSFNKYL